MGRSRAGLTARQARSREMAARALELRKSGATYTAIAREVGYFDAANARRAILAALDRITAEPAEEVKRWELARLDDLLLEAKRVLMASHPVLYRGRPVMVPRRQPDGSTTQVVLEDGTAKLAAIGKILSIMDRRARFLGLDAPRSFELSGIDGAPIALTVDERAVSILDALNAYQAGKEDQEAAAELAENGSDG